MKETKEGAMRSVLVLLLLCTALLSLSYFVHGLSVGTSAGGQITAVNANFTNISGNGRIQLNATISYGPQATGPYGGITNLTWSFIFGPTQLITSSIGIHNDSNVTDSGGNANLNVSFTWTTYITPSFFFFGEYDGNYTITVNVSNFTGSELIPNDNLGSGIGNRSSSNIVRGFVVDSTAPQVQFLMANISNRTNLTTANGVTHIQFNVSANDTTTWTQAVLLELRNATGAAGGGGAINYTVNRTNTFNMFSVAFAIYTNNSNLSDDEYTLYLYMNDSVNNTNASLATNFSFRKDTTPPIINNFSLVYLDRSIVFNLTNLSNATPQFILNFTDNLSISANCTIYINSTLGVSNGAVANATATNLTTSSALVEGHHVAYAACTDGSGNIGNSTNQTGAPTIGVGRLTFLTDTIAPPVTSFANVSNATNLSFAVTSGTDFGSTNFSVQYNISSNDTTSTTVVVKFGIRNASSEMNITTTKNSALGTFFLAIPINTSTADDYYTVVVYANDSVSNLNNSIANFSFRVDRTPPSYNLFHLFGRNGSSVNLTNLSATSVDFRFNFTDNLSISANCTLYVNGTLAASNSSAVNATALNLTATSLAEGKHIASVACTDGSNNQGNTTSTAAARGALTFTVDTIPPNLSAETFVLGNFSGYAGHDARYVGINLSAGLSEGNYTLYVLVNDSSTHPQHVRFNVSNSSGPIRPFNYTAFKNGTNYTALNFNVSQLAEGWYNLSVWTNDSVNNINGSLRLTFVVDRTKPGVSVTCSPSNPTAGQTVTCSCTGSDEYPGSGLSTSVSFAGGGSEQSTTAVGSGSFTSGICTSVDYAGNRNTATGSWTVTAASTGGSGGGGSGGGASAGVAGQFEKKVWTSINAGETATVPIKNGVIGFTEVSFSISDTAYGAWIQVTKKDSLPSSVSSFEGKVYRTVEITRSPTLKEVMVQNPAIKFKVEKAWLTEKKLLPAQVGLFHYVDGEWNELPTTQGEDDGKYIHYTAVTPGFSYFIIGEKKTPAAPAAPVEETPAPVAEAPVPEVAAPPEEAAKALRLPLRWIVLVVVALAVLLLAWYLLTRRRSHRR